MSVSDRSAPLVSSRGRRVGGVLPHVHQSLADDGAHCGESCTGLLSCLREGLLSLLVSTEERGMEGRVEEERRGGEGWREQWGGEEGRGKT